MSTIQPISKTNTGLLQNQSPNDLEMSVKNNLPQYTYADAPVGKIIIAAIKTGKLSLDTLVKLARDNAGHHVDMRKAALGQLQLQFKAASPAYLERVVSESFPGFTYSDTPEGRIILAVIIYTGKLSLDTLVKLARDNAGHHVAMRKAALDQLQLQLKGASPKYLERVVSESLPGYTYPDAPDGQIILVVINTGKLSFATLEKLAKDNIGHHKATQKAAQKQLGLK